MLQDNPSNEPNASTAPTVLNLNWAFGLNKGIPGGVHALSDGIRTAVFYATGHTGVLYDYTTKKQHLLQGHVRNLCGILEYNWTAVDTEHRHLVNKITCTAITVDRRWIVTADSGANSTMIVWDTMPYLAYYEGSKAELATAIQAWNLGKILPVKTVFEPHNGAGIRACDFSGDGKYLVTLGADSPQTLSIWDWSQETETPIHTVTLSGEQQNVVKFNTDDSSELITTGNNSVVFLTWDKEQIKTFVPSLDSNETKHTITGLTYSCFLTGTPLAITGTLDGEVIVWSDRSLNNLSVKLPKGEKCAVKFARLHNLAVNFLVCVSGREPTQEAKERETKDPLSGHDTDSASSVFLISGSEDGGIKVHDTRLRLLWWWDGGKVGPGQKTSKHGIGSIAVGAVTNRMGEKVPGIVSDVDVPELVFSTHQGKIIMLSRNGTPSTASSDVNNANTAVPAVRTLTNIHPGIIKTMCPHPNNDHFAVAGDAGILEIWDYTTKEVVMSKNFEIDDVGHDHPVHDGLVKKSAKITKVPEGITCMEYNPSGDLLVLGFATGRVAFLRADTLEPIDSWSWQVGTSAITIITWSQDGNFVGVADASHAVSVFRREHVPLRTLSPENAPKRVDEVQSRKDEHNWVWLGKWGAHYKKVVGLVFLAATDENGPRLVTCSQDRRSAIFDLNESSVAEGLKLLSHVRIEQTAVPLAMIRYPRTSAKATETMLMVPNSDFKFRLYNSSTLLCRKTVSAPVYGGSITGIYPVPTNVSMNAGLGTNDAANLVQEPKYFIFKTDRKVVGAGKFPLDGNPHKAMGLIAHPGEISSVCCSRDGAYLFTAGPEDGVVNMWTVNTNALEAQIRLGGEGMTPFLRMLDPSGLGTASPLYKEMEDYFYYAQLRAQGEDTKDDREIRDAVPIEQIPSIVQAVGFYPSENDIINMQNEIKYSKLDETGEFTTQVTFDEVIRLYVNHRPVRDVTIEEIAAALAHAKDIEEALTQEPGERPLRKDGLKMTESVTRAGILSLLQQYGETMSKADFEETLRNLLVSLGGKKTDLPESFTVSEFVERVLGFEVPPTVDPAVEEITDRLASA